MGGVLGLFVYWVDGWCSVPSFFGEGGSFGVGVRGGGGVGVEGGGGEEACTRSCVTLRVESS